LGDETLVKKEPLPHETFDDVEREIMLDIEIGFKGVDGTCGGGKDFWFKRVDIPLQISAGVTKMLNGSQMSPFITSNREKLDVGCRVGAVNGEELR
jgi:hypothetical protein